MAYRDVPRRSITIDVDFALARRRALLRVAAAFTSVAVLVTGGSVLVKRSSENAHRATSRDKLGALLDCLRVDVDATPDEARERWGAEGAWRVDERFGDSTGTCQGMARSLRDEMHPRTEGELQQPIERLLEGLNRSPRSLSGILDTTFEIVAAYTDAGFPLPPRTSGPRSPAPSIAERLGQPLSVTIYGSRSIQGSAGPVAAFYEREQALPALLCRTTTGTLPTCAPFAGRDGAGLESGSPPDARVPSSYRTIFAGDTRRPTLALSESPARLVAFDGTRWTSLGLPPATQIFAFVPGKTPSDDVFWVQTNEPIGGRFGPREMPFRGGAVDWKRPGPPPPMPGFINQCSAGEGAMRAYVGVERLVVQLDGKLHELSLAAPYVTMTVADTDGVAVPAPVRVMPEPVEAAACRADGRVTLLRGFDEAGRARVTRCAFAGCTTSALDVTGLANAPMSAPPLLSLDQVWRAPPPSPRGARAVLLDDGRVLVVWRDAELGSFHSWLEGGDVTKHFLSLPPRDEARFSLVSAGKGAVFAVAYRGATYALPIASDGTVGPPIVPRPAGSEP